jgi:hypothetical protein
MPADGIAIQVSVAIERPLPASLRRKAWPPRIEPSQVVGPFEGLPGRIGVYQWHGVVRSLEVNVMLFFGRNRATERQVAAAEAELRAGAIP